MTGLRSGPVEVGGLGTGLGRGATFGVLLVLRSWVGWAWVPVPAFRLAQREVLRRLGCAVGAWGDLWRLL